MSKTPPPKNPLLDDGNLHEILRHYDPVTPPSSVYLMSLEAEIMAAVSQEAQNPAFSDTWLFANLFQKKGAARAALVAALLVLAAGFIAGQTFFETENTTTASNGLSLIAFADEAPTAATDDQWGDTDDAQ